VENFDGVENQDNKKENQFRSSLNKSQRSTAQSEKFFLLSSLSILTLTIAIALSISFSREMTSSITLANNICLPTAIPRLLLRDIRTQQNFIYLYPKYSNQIVNTNLTAVSSPESFNSDHKARMKRYIGILEQLREAGASGKLTGKLLDDFTNPVYTIYAPVLYFSPTFASPPNYTQCRNASISEITDSLIKYSNNFLQYGLDDYSKTTH